MAQLPTTYFNISDIYERLEALEYCISKHNEMLGNINSVLKNLVEDKKVLAEEVQTSKGTSNRTAGRSRRRNANTDSE